MNSSTLSAPQCPTDWRGQPFSDELIRSQIDKFQWFVPVSFGNGIIAQPASWRDAPLDWPHMGVAKFDYIVRRNLPDLQGKRILDIGCNTGIIAIHMARLGAAEVVGVDHESPEAGSCDKGWRGWKEQAEFVKAALEWRCRTTYNVRYIDCDMRDLPSLDLGTFDVVMALNCLYYLPENDMKRVSRHISTLTNHFLVQCNTKDHRNLAFSRRAEPKFFRALLQESGFPLIDVDHPWEKPLKWIWPRRYFRPVVVGRKR